MKYVGIDLHKKTIVICVVNKERKVLTRRISLLDRQNVNPPSHVGEVGGHAQGTLGPDAAIGREMVAHDQDLRHSFSYLNGLLLIAYSMAAAGT